MNYQRITRVFLAVALIAAILVPAPAVAVQHSVLPDPTALRIPTAPGRDPYLAQAINNLPNYSYQQAGNVLALASPITKEGDWPRPVVVAVPKPKPVARPVTVPLLPSNGALIVLEGEASYYSRAGCLGCNPALIMANGQTLDDNALTMAIGANLKHLVGHNAKVTSLATGKSVIVRITDTGGFYQAKYGHRVADLTIATKNSIGMAGGVGQVRVEVF